MAWQWICHVFINKNNLISLKSSKIRHRKRNAIMQEEWGREIMECRELNEVLIKHHQSITDYGWHHCFSKYTGDLEILNGENMNSIIQLTNKVQVHKIEIYELIKK